jgi:hypothetical protein
MTKHAQVIPGQTPSAVSGRPSELIKEGEAACRDEEVESLEKVAAAADSVQSGWVTPNPSK